MIIRQEMGDMLREMRTDRHLTLRSLAAKAGIASGYLSEIERGEKEASHQILMALTNALEIPVSLFFYELAERLAQVEGHSVYTSTRVPDTVPDSLRGISTARFARPSSSLAR